MVKIWHARECEVKIEANPTITTAALLDSFFTGSSISGSIKNLAAKLPESEVEKIDLLGEDTNGFQNAEGEENPYSMAEISGTLVLPGDEVTETLFFPTGTTIASTHTRYRAGTGTRKRPAFLINLDDGSDEVSYVLDNTWVTVNSDLKITGSDGHWEFDFTAKCLPKDCYGPEVKN